LAQHYLEFLQIEFFVLAIALPLKVATECNSVRFGVVEALFQEKLVEGVKVILEIVRVVCFFDLVQ